MTTAKQPTKTPPPRLRRRTPLWIVFSGVMLLGVAGLLAYRWLMPMDGPLPDDMGANYTGLERGVTEDGFYYLGDADAPIVIEDFSSFACPHCRDFHNERLPDLLDEIAGGQVRFVMVPVPTIGSGARNATRAAFCAGEQGMFWEMTDVLYFWQGEFLTSIFDERRIEDGATNMGLDMAAFESCFDAAATETQVDRAAQVFSSRGLRGTPTFFINGEEVEDYREFDQLSERLIPTTQDE